MQSGISRDQRVNDKVDIRTGCATAERGVVAPQYAQIDKRQFRDVHPAALGIRNRIVVSKRASLFEREPLNEGATLQIHATDSVRTERSIRTGSRLAANDSTRCPIDGNQGNPVWNKHPVGQRLPLGHAPAGLVNAIGNPYQRIKPGGIQRRLNRALGEVPRQPVVMVITAHRDIKGTGNGFHLNGMNNRRRREPVGVARLREGQFDHPGGIGMKLRSGDPGDRGLGIQIGILHSKSRCAFRRAGHHRAHANEGSVRRYGIRNLLRGLRDDHRADGGTRVLRVVNHARNHIGPGIHRCGAGAVVGDEYIAGNHRVSRCRRVVGRAIVDLPGHAVQRHRGNALHDGHDAGDGTLIHRIHQPSGHHVRTHIKRQIRRTVVGTQHIHSGRNGVHRHGQADRGVRLGQRGRIKRQLRAGFGYGDDPRG